MSDVLVRDLHPGVVARFRQNVAVGGENDCWLWTGRVNEKGYGQLSYGGHRSRYIKAHRLAYLCDVGEIPVGKVIMHTCDVRACCNPLHLRAATQAENLKDMRDKGRGGVPPHKPGSSNPSSVISEADVKFIRASPMTGVALSKMFGIAQSTVSAIRKRKLWKNV